MADESGERTSPVPIPEGTPITPEGLLTRYSQIKDRIAEKGLVLAEEVAEWVAFKGLRQNSETYWNELNIKKCEMRKYYKQF